MRIAYIVAAHTKLDQLERLLRRLVEDDTQLIVHVDKRAGDEAFSLLQHRMRDLDIHYLDRHLGFWGGFGVVRAALGGLRHLVADGARFDYVVLLSGQDYPLRPRAEINSALQRAAGRSFLYNFPLPFAGWGRRGGFDRVEDWHLISHRALHIRLPWKRRIPGGLAPYGGGRPWLLEHSAAVFVDDFVRTNPAIVRFFEHTLYPCELFFQTILMNSPLADSIVSDHRQYLRWEGGASPRILTVDDLGEMLASDALFARKFDTANDVAVLDRLDELLDRTDVVAR
jgi:Core-2/I-Branching enzyme